MPKRVFEAVWGLTSGARECEEHFSLHAQPALRPWKDACYDIQPQYRGA